MEEEEQQDEPTQDSYDSQDEELPEEDAQLVEQEWKDSEARELELHPRARQRKSTAKMLELASARNWMDTDTISSTAEASSTSTMDSSNC
jgi:hypothetical protein